jgi:hypothetical protein
MSARKHSREVSEEGIDFRPRQQTPDFTYPPPFRQTQDFIEEDPPGWQGSDSCLQKNVATPPTLNQPRTPSKSQPTASIPRPARKRRRTTTGRTTLNPLVLPQRVLLRHVFFLNAEKSRYVSVGFYPARFSRVLTEFGGPRISPIILMEQILTTLMEHLPKLCEAMCRGERYACKDSVFWLVYSGGTTRVVRMYQDTRYIIFKFADLRYLIKMVNFVQVLQAKCILVRDDFRPYPASALGSTEFIEPNPLAISTCVIPYDHLFDELKMPFF